MYILIYQNAMFKFNFVDVIDSQVVYDQGNNLFKERTNLPKFVRLQVS
ncbi:12856_t:CDS:1, partial [Funneliformis caledonium]